MMKKIMFVCHGNICRSPMAEFIFKKLIREAGRESEFYIASAATSDETVFYGKGSHVYGPAQKELAKHGISCADKLSVQLKKADYEKYDLFIGMDSANIRNMQRIFSGDAHGKVHKLMDYTGKCTDVEDPWYTREFDVAYADIYEGCTALLEVLA